MEFKGTKGKWYYERTSREDGDFQARILCNQGDEFHSGEIKPKIYIITGEPQKINGQSNIHVEANAKLISKAPEMLEMLKMVNEGINMMAFDQLEVLQKDIEQIIKEATEL